MAHQAEYYLDMVPILILVSIDVSSPGMHTYFLGKGVGLFVTSLMDDPFDNSAEMAPI